VKHFLGHCPGDAYASDIYAANIDDARARLREMRSVKRLPRGTAVWEFTPAAQKSVRESMLKLRADYARAGQIADF